MFKFKKIYLILTAFLACTAFSVSAFAVPETAAEEPIYETEIAAAISGEVPPVIIGEDVTEPADVVETTEAVSDPKFGGDPYPGGVADAYDAVPPSDELISPPYDPSSGELPPERNESGEMFSGFEKGTGSIDNILDYWEINGYPEYVSFICDQGVTSYDVATQTETVYHLWEIGIADINDEKKEEVRSLISSEQHLYFTDCTYNLTERRQIAETIMSAYPLAIAELSKYSEAIEVAISGYSEDEWDKIEAEILAMFDNNSRLIHVLKMVPTVGIPETFPETGADNIGTEIGIATAPVVTAGTVEETAIASNIDIVPPISANQDSAAPLDPVPETLVPRTEAAAGENGYDIGGVPGTTAGALISDSVIREEGIVSNPEVSGAISEIGGVAAMINAESQRDKADSLWIWICAAAAAVVAITAAVILGRKHVVKSVSLADGGEVTVGGKVTKGEIVKAVRESEIKPDDKVFGEIMERVKGE